MSALAASESEYPLRLRVVLLTEDYVTRAGSAFEAGETVALPVDEAQVIVAAGMAVKA